MTRSKNLSMFFERKASCCPHLSQAGRGTIVGGGFAAASATAFGAMPVLAKVAYRTGLTPQQLLVFRFAIAAIGMAVITVGTLKGKRWMAPHEFFLVFALGVVFGVQSLLFFQSLRTLDASIAQLVFFTHPILVALGGRAIFGRSMSRGTAAALMLSVLGTVLLVRGVSLGGRSALLLATAASGLYALYLLVADRYLPRSYVAATTVTLLGAGVALLLLSTLSGQLVQPGTGKQWGVLVLLSIVPMVAIPTLFAALSRIGATRTSLIGCCEPVVTVVLAALVLGDRLRALQGVGATFVVVAAVVVVTATGARTGSRSSKLTTASCPSCRSLGG